MNRFTSRQRKIAYVIGIVALLVPIIMLGRPPESVPGQAFSGGELARMRVEYKLAESSLGSVDPSSAAMNLVLLGMRGVAADLLWVEALEQQKVKNWGQMRAIVEGITLLQPHFVQVWRYQGWNLAFNVSAEWDQVSRRYSWVKEGGKFIQNGARRNQRFGELYWEAGNIYGKKIGRSDEWKFFRQYFMKDPDPRFEGGPDKEFNPDGVDNYLVAREWFLKANEAEQYKRQHIMDRPLFRAYPSRSLFDQADAMQREGTFGERTRLVWQDALKDWTTVYGQELFYISDDIKTIQLNADEDVARKLAEQDGMSLSDKIRWIDHYQKLTNYRYWRGRAIAEADPDTSEAHRELYAGRKKYEEQDYGEAIRLLESGMNKLASTIRRHPYLVEEGGETLTIEEAMLAMLRWRNAYRLIDKPLPNDYPLKSVWLTHQANMRQFEDLLKMESRVTD